ncbi:hypothetical protein BV25DRAFT_1915884 [Artomyces pyxidatus]|uniref:Uncharacterized protein n=1 Tax=Artomyces pyxidatus TaxID=48021 RepID=A0ACB8T302_9AGAM|nr:hypothetical protein BV25DRAFT_1915884 [Artomyces pyxidatus]
MASLVMLSIAANGTTSFTSAGCTDIAICRTRYTIIWSSLVTILACVWSAVHRNIAGPARPGESRARRVVGSLLEVAKIVVVTLLVPEWVLAWAVRQFLNARDLARQLEGSRGEAKSAWSDKRARLQGMKPEKEKKRERSKVGSWLEDDSGGALVAFEESMVAVDGRVGRLDGKWKTRHGFFIIMGGFHYYENGVPKHPLSRWDVAELVRTGDLVPPTEGEIRGWSQGDALSKTLAVVQTLWFVVQCIARAIEGLPITQIEIMTLAYTTITVAMYVAWWEKPQNVGSPVRVAMKLPPPRPVMRRRWYRRVFYAIAGWQDVFSNLREELRVPTFYGGNTGEDGNGSHADVVALCAAMVFGAVHCAAWNYAFPSHTERLIWRISSLAIVAVPGAMLLVVLVYLGTDGTQDVLETLAFPPVFLLSGPIYVAARLLLLTLSFTTLRSLPYQAYQAVQWTLRIPHFT